MNLIATAGKQEVKTITVASPPAMRVTIEAYGAVSVFNFNDADPTLIEEISRLIKGFFAILKRRAEAR